MKKNRVGAYFLLTFLILAVISGITAYSLLWTPNDLKTASALKAGDTLSILASSMKLGGTMELTEEEVNTLLNQYVKASGNGGDFKIDNISSTLGEDKINFNVLGRYHKLKIYISTSGELQYNGEKISYIPEGFRMGKIPVPKKLALKLLSGRIPVSSDKKRLEFDKSKLPVDLESLEIKERKLHIKFKLPLKSSLSKNNESEAEDLNNISSNESSRKSAFSSSVTEKNSLSSKAIANEIAQKTAEQTEKISSQLKTNNEKQLIAMISNLLEKLLSDGTYKDSTSFKYDLAKTSILYSKLSESEKAEVEKAANESLHKEMEQIFPPELGVSLDLESLMNLLSLLGK